MLNVVCKYLMLICLLLFGNRVTGQDVEQVLKAPVMVGNGGVSMSHIANYSPDSVAHLTPYAYFLTGTMNLKCYGVVDLPFSFSYTNNQTASRLPQPFNRFSLSPSYRWITTHLGYASMTFSPYTLSGHEFFGGGVELTPEGSWKVAALYGRFSRAVRADTLGSAAVYRRLGGGFKVDYGADDFDVSWSVLKVKDDEGSLVFDEAGTGYVTPQDNLSGSVSVALRMIPTVTLSAEYGVSAINRDVSGRQQRESEWIDPFLETQGDLAVYHAVKGQLTQVSAIGSIGATYERVAPNYNTFGAYYFHNDFENITANYSTQMINWLNFSVDGGYQRDNLDGQKVNSSHRMIYSVNANATVTKRLNVGLAFSNVESYQHIRDVYEDVTRTNEYQFLDTLRFTQLSRMASVNAGYVLESSSRQRQLLTAGFTYQEASEQQNDDARFVGSRIYQSMSSYQYALIPIRLNVTTTVSHHRNATPEMLMDVMSYHASVQKGWWDQLKTALTGTYSQSYRDGQTLSRITNVRMTAGYSLMKKHQFNLSGALLNNVGQQREVTQFSVNLAYSYVFGFSTKTRGEKNNGGVGL